MFSDVEGHEVARLRKSQARLQVSCSSGLDVVYMHANANEICIYMNGIDRAAMMSRVTECK